jgi:hypothetical protein
MTPEPVWSARRRLARAGKHIVDFEAETDAYLSTDPYAIVREINARMASEFTNSDFIPRPIFSLSSPSMRSLTCVLASIMQLTLSPLTTAYVIALNYSANLAKRAHFPISDGHVRQGGGKTG